MGIMSEEIHTPRSIRLRTMDGRFVADIRSPFVAAMSENDKAPEIVLWGERLFRRDDQAVTSHRLPVEYVEGFMYVVLPTDRVDTEQAPLSDA